MMAWHGYLQAIKGSPIAGRRNSFDSRIVDSLYRRARYIGDAHCPDAGSASCQTRLQVIHILVRPGLLP